MLLLTPVVRPATSWFATPSEATPFSYWSIKPWFLIKGNTCCFLITPSSWGFPTCAPSISMHKEFLAPLQEATPHSSSTSTEHASLHLPLRQNSLKLNLFC